MRKSILTEPVEIMNRLDEIGLTLEELLEIVGAMVAARNSCTENDPASAPGWMAWKEGTRRLREVGLPKGWARDDSNQIPSIIDVQRGIKLAVCNTDDGTCRLNGRIPQNRTKKGPATDRIVSEQGSLFSPAEIEKVSPLRRGKSQPGIIASYYLCVYHEGDDVRAELSCPVEVDGGYFSDFVERIFLAGGGDDDGGVVVRRDEPEGDEGAGGEEFDIPVSRKS